MNQLIEAFEAERLRLRDGANALMWLAECRLDVAPDDVDQTLVDRVRLLANAVEMLSSLAARRR